MNLTEIWFGLGSDLTTLGLNLNSPEPLYNNFGGPWAENPCRPQDIDFHVPPEYLTNAVIRDKLATVKLNRYQEDLLFYLFYTNVGDAMQLAASLELYNRDWRYHKVYHSFIIFLFFLFLFIHFLTNFECYQMINIGFTYL